MKIRQDYNKVFLVGFVLILAVIVWTLARPAVLRMAEKDSDSEEKTNEEIMKAPLVTARNLFEKSDRKEKVFLVDLSPPEDFARGHIAASENIAAAQLNKQQLSLLGIEAISDVVILNKGEDVLETARKTNELVADGFRNAKYLQGGIIAWAAEGYSLVSYGGSANDDAKIKTISLDQMNTELSGGEDSVQFLDVRDAESFAAGHIPGALNLTLSEIEKDHGKISAVRKVIIYGESDDEARPAAVALFDLNFFNAYVLAGGLDAWKAAGGKIE